MPENQASTLELLVGVSRGDGPLQRQVEDQLRAAIRLGRLVEGERLPASRTLAADLGVSRGVVSDAYMQLAAEGWLIVAPRERPRVAAAATHAAPVHPAALARAGHQAALAGPAHPAALAGPAHPAALAGPAHLAARTGPGHPAAPAHPAALTGPGHPAGFAAPPHAAPGPDVRIAPGSIPRPARIRYDLRPGRPDLARFPRADWVRSLSAAVRGAGVAELDYPPIAGAIPLREVVAAYRGRVRGTVARAEDVILCAGAGQAFVTIAEALGPVKLAVEDPGHEGIRGLFAKRGLEPAPDARRRAGHRRRRAARRRPRRPAHARPPVPDRRRAQRRAPGASCSPGPPSTTR